MRKKPLTEKVKRLIKSLIDLEIFEKHILGGYSSQVICRLYGGIHHTRVFWACIDTIQSMPFGGDFDNIEIHRRIAIREWLAKQKAPIIREINKLVPKEI